MISTYIKKNKLALFTLFLISSIYILVSWVINEGSFKQTHLSYYNYLLNAFLNGRLNVAPYLNSTDITQFNGKWYMYWGPAPAVFILPFYFIGRTKTSDVIYTLFAGILNVSLFYLVLNEFNKTFKLKKRVGDLLFILVSFALASPHFYLSLQGRIWHTNQVIAITFITSFLFFYLKYWDSTKNITILAIAIIFLNLAVLSRYSMIFYFSLLLPLIWKIFQSGDKKLLFKVIKIILFISMFFFSLMSLYNYLRFGNIFETGVSYMYIRSSENIFIKGSDRSSLVSFKYFWHNFHTYFLNHININFSKPFLSIDKEGNSIFSVYPLLILFPLLFIKKNLLGKKYSSFFLASLLGVITPVIIYLLFYLATGWAQFGTRYFLDIIPILFLILLVVVDRIPFIIKASILTYGIFVNIAGAILFYSS